MINNNIILFYMSELLSQGGYGCVYYPSLTCTGKAESSKKSVSKIQRKDWASKNEIEIGKLVKKIANSNSFFLPITSSCNINISSIDNKLVKDCRVIQKRPDSDYVLMKMNYLENISFTNYLKSSGESNAHLILKVVESFRNLASSLEKLADIDVVHHDLKLDNILVSAHDNLPVIIDFGISLNMKNISETDNRLKDYFYVHAPDYYPWSLDIHIINYIVQVRSDGEYGAINFEELREIADDYCKGNLALDVFSDDFKKAYKKKCYSYINSLVGKRNNEILRILLNNYKYWDIYALSVIYIRLIGFIFNNKYPKTKFLSEFVELNLINLSPNPNERFSCKDSIKYIDDIISKEDSLRDLSKTIKSINIDDQTLTDSIESGMKNLKKVAEKGVYKFT
tara:strand:- start:937 stop:2124 length:1188 start_codon:yes stop_codon:yes gene_type:complete